MSHPVRPSMSITEFLDWQQLQDARHELVDGEPVAMAGARQRHDRVTANILGELYNQLRGKPCRSFTADLAVVVPEGNVRRPDAGVYCGPFDDDALVASDPRLLLEVLSRSTRTLDQVGKLEEYKTIEMVACIALVDPDAPEAIVWSRMPSRAWHHVTLRGLDAVIEVPEIEVALRLGDVYAGLDFAARPRLVSGDEQGRANWNS